MARNERRADTLPAEETTTGGAGDMAQNGYARLAAFQKDNFYAMVRFNTILRDGAAEWTNGLLDFAGQNLNRPGRPNGGADPAQAALSGAQCIQTATEQYLDQTAKFLSLAAKISRDCRVHLESHAATVLKHLTRDDGSIPPTESRSAE